MMTSDETVTSKFPITKCAAPALAHVVLMPNSYSIYAKELINLLIGSHPHVSLDQVRTDVGNSSLYASLYSIS